MKRAITLLLFSGLLSTYAAAQCAGPTSFSNLDINYTDAFLMHGGDAWWDFSRARYESPAGTGKSPLFSGALWVGGLDDQDDLHLAGILYRQTGNDYFPGPIVEDSVMQQTFCNAWDRHWKVSKADIDFFINGGTPAEAIMSWPAKGNPEAPSPITEDLAPFVDVNEDGIYRYTDGDYPLIKGDQAVFWVFNDIGNIHSETSGSALGFEFHAMAYAYLVDGTDVDYATYYQYNIINKSSDDYHDLYLGHYLDIDLGNSTDDYIGVDVDRNMVFGYNGDTIDEGLTGYGTNIPMVGLRVNRGPNDLGMHAAHYFDVSLNGNYSSPSIPIDYYNYMRGLFRDGTIKLDGNGNATTYQLDGSNLASPSMCADGFLPAEYRAMQSYGPLDLATGEMTSINYSVVLDFDTAFQGLGCPNYTPFGNAADVVDSRYQFTRCDDFIIDITADIQDASLDQAGSIHLVSLGTEGTYSYEWSNGAKTRNIDGISGGPYAVTITNADGCTHTESFQVLDGPGGVNDVGAAVLQLYPNPAREQMVVKGMSGTRSFEVRNLLGELVSAGVTHHHIDVAHLASGAYFLLIDGYAPMKFQKMD